MASIIIETKLIEVIHAPEIDGIYVIYKQTGGCCKSDNDELTGRLVAFYPLTCITYLLSSQQAKEWIKKDIQKQIQNGE